MDSGKENSKKKAKANKPPIKYLKKKKKLKELINKLEEKRKLIALNISTIKLKELIVKFERIRVIKELMSILFINTLNKNNNKKVSSKNISKKKINQFNDNNFNNYTNTKGRNKVNYYH